MSEVDPIQEAIDEQYPVASGEDTGFDAEAADEAASSSSGDSGADTPMLLGKFKDADALANAYQELEKQFHARNQQPAEEEVDADPFWMPGYTTEEAQRLAEFALSGPENAQRAFEYAQQNGDVFGVDGTRITNELFQLWQAQDPLGSQRYLIQGMLEEQRAALQQEFEPLQQQYSAQAVDLAVNQAVASMPGFGDRTQAVLDHIQSIPGLLDRINQDPAYRSSEAITGLLKQAFANVMLEEYMQQAAAQNPNSAQPASSAPKPKTASRSTTAKPASDDVFDELFGQGAFAAAD